LQNKLGEIGIFRKHRAVTVGAEDVFIPCAFGLILAVIAEAVKYRTERGNPLTEIGLTAVVFKSDDL
jgi:hypothetical protein